jgi:hypothetical protein
MLEHDIVVIMEAFLDIKDVRTTNEEIKRVSAIDVIKLVLKTSNKSASTILNRIQAENSEVSTICRHWKFPGTFVLSAAQHARLIKMQAIFHSGARQRETPVVDAHGLVTILNLLPGKRAAEFRAKSADIIVRYLGGDETLISEIKDMRRMQEELRNVQPDHPVRFFADDVERRRQQAPGLPEWAIEWRESRTEQKIAGKRLRDTINNFGYDSVRVATTVENAKNQAVVGFEGNTNTFKKKHGISPHAALADWCTRDQLDMRRMIANKIQSAFKAMNDPTATKMKRAAEKISSETGEMCKFLEIQGFSESHVAAHVRNLEKSQAALSARIRKLESKSNVSRSNTFYIQDSVVNNSN